MDDNNFNASMMEMYILEVDNLIEQLENIIIRNEKNNYFSSDDINEIFRLMHTIKGSSSMMMFNDISSLSHSMEDLFYYIREKTPQNIDFSSLSDIILEGIDFIKVEIQKIKENDEPDGDSSALRASIQAYLTVLKNENDKEIEIIRAPSLTKKQYYIAPDLKSEELYHYFSVKFHFEQECEMQNIRAFTLTNNIQELCEEIKHFPENIIEDDTTASYIKEKGFVLYLKTINDENKIMDFFNNTPFLTHLEFKLMGIEEIEILFSKEKQIALDKSYLDDDESSIKNDKSEEGIKHKVEKTGSASKIQTSINVNVQKLDKLMDLVGEMVIAESMVTQNPEIKSLELENFHKASRHLHKITNELQDIVMSIRMVSLSTTFLKMHRIVRDMSKKLSKEVSLVLIGEDTEVDKNIIEHIADPLMHLIRNAIDHGIEDKSKRIEKGKPEVAKLILEAKNLGSDVLISVKDDGKGLNKESILQKGMEKNLVWKSPEELSEKEIFNLILIPGFSTNENVTEFSGRGVGMDVVSKNIEMVGGSIAVDSVENKGTTITMKIPLTLAIIEGMNIKVGKARYTIPITSIKEAFRPQLEQCIKDPDNNEMVMIRGNCYPILRLHEYYNVKTAITDFLKGILVMVQQEDNTVCLFVDELIGQQQVVVKTLPSYIKRTKNIRGLAGCTLLGDGSISLILDVSQLK